MNKKTLLIVFGGKSSEHDVSTVSASCVAANVPRDKYDVIMLGITKEGKWLLFDGDASALPDDHWLNNPDRLTPAAVLPDSSVNGVAVFAKEGVKFIKPDCVFPVLHGKNGEDGTVQGLFELAEIPFVGCDMLSSADCMDKAVTNTLADNAGIAQAKWLCIHEGDYREAPEDALRHAAEYLGFPIFVKPANAGSSVGISKASCEKELADAFETAFVHDEKLVLEEAIVGAEVECAVLGYRNPIVAEVGEIVPCNEFYDYEAKYISGTSELFIPARFSDEKRREVADTALKAYKALGCGGLSRVDFFVRKSDGAVLFNEINTIPGFTPISMYPKLFAHSGIPYSELIDRLVTLAIENRKA